jgi:signal transduction histidine kinase
MNTELARLDRLINQLLEVARLNAIGQQSEPEMVPLEPLLRHCAQAACLQHKLEINDVFKFHTTPLALTSRRILLEMIFGNLMDNAVKYGGQPPRIVVSATPLGLSRISIQIQDNGTGVAPEHRRRIFQMFFRGNDELQRTRTGTGLGLYIVRTLVNLLQGRITVKNAAEGGSVFEVILPGRQAAPPDSTASESSSRVPRIALSSSEKPA